jgi:hypothetical protein
MEYQGATIMKKILFACSLVFCVGSLVCMEKKSTSFPIKTENATDIEKKKALEKEEPTTGVFTCKKIGIGVVVLFLIYAFWRSGSDTTIYTRKPKN